MQELIALDIHYRRRLAEPIDVDDYCQRFPFVNRTGLIQLLDAVFAAGQRAVHRQAGL